ncbi:MAG: Gfo/Idh/MocA family oxidoreductase [Pseudomonadota bacterium]
MSRRVAIVGAGIGAEHLRAYLALPDRFEVACICDLDAARAKSIAEPHGIRTEAEMSAVLSDSSIEIVDICLPPHLHLSACLAALDAGKTVICEKPLVTSLSDADTLATKLAESDGGLFPVFQYRYGLGTAEFHALQDAGLLGACFAGALETHWDRDSAYYTVGWRGTWAGEQGGALLGHAIHSHDLLTALLGPVSRIYAETTTLVNPIEVEDCAAVSLRMASGAVITSSVTLGAAGNTSRLRLMFEGCTVESDHAAYAPAAASWSFKARAPTEQSQIDAAIASVTAAPVGFVGYLTDIADHLDGKPSRAVLIEDGRRSIEFVTAAYHSARINMPVTLPIEADHPLYKGWVPGA